MNIREGLRSIAAEELDWDEELPRGPLSSHFDSMQLMTLVVAVEDRFEVILEPEDEEAIETIDDLVETIERKRNG